MGVAVAVAAEVAAADRPTHHFLHPFPVRAAVEVEGVDLYFHLQLPRPFPVLVPVAAEVEGVAAEVESQDYRCQKRKRVHPHHNPRVAAGSVVANYQAVGGFEAGLPELDNTHSDQ